ncbi:MAG TPA: N-acetylgalactosamine 6-sulfate sulfatase, partial [Candidatus Hydrogenedentes bacterium]|nr:N-acetylgalactosamine 6-sulfate sulfatase [Candidatus Hydrogenedentota bacterium]
AAPVCSPTRGSVMTGRHPNRFGCFKWGHPLRPQEITIAEALKTAGYVTGHFGKWHLGSVQKGSPVNPGASGFDTWFSAPNYFDNDPIMSREGIAQPALGESSMITVDAALQFIAKHAQGTEPFLAVVWFGSPHSPHKAIEQDRAPYKDQDAKLQHFYGEITGMDRAFGKLRDGIRQLGIRDDTLLWYCSDNGGLPRVGATGGRGHKGQIYEGGLRVPALLEWHGHIKAPQTTAIPCVTSDIYPTLLDITGVAIPHQPPLDGLSLVPLLDGAMDARPKPIGFWDFPAQGIRTPSAEWMSELLEAQKAGKETTDIERLCLDAAKIDHPYPPNLFAGHAAWLDWPWKLHRKQEESGESTIELYNLAADPMETKDRAAHEPDRVQTMQTALDTWRRSVVRSLNGADYA